MMLHMYKTIFQFDYTNEKTVKENITMSLTKYEQETIINFNEHERTASVYTHNKRLIHKLSENCKRHPDFFKLEKDDGQAKTFIIAKRYISIRTPRESRKYTEEEKENIRERFQRAKAI